MSWQPSHLFVSFFLWVLLSDIRNHVEKLILEIWKLQDGLHEESAGRSGEIQVQWRQAQKGGAFWVFQWFGHQIFITSWWFQRYFTFNPIPEEMIQSGAHNFSGRLKTLLLLCFCSFQELTTLLNKTRQKGYEVDMEVRKIFLPKWNTSPLKNYPKPQKEGKLFSKHHFSGANSLLNFGGLKPNISSLEEVAAVGPVELTLIYRSYMIQ